jgi:hypothetical protein
MDESYAGTSQAEVPEGNVEQIAPQTPASPDVSPDGGFTPIDIDDDGTADGFWGTIPEFGTFVVLDENGDGTPDYTEIDVNDDGQVDVTVQREEGGFRVAIDTDGDGLVDAEKVLTEAELQAQMPALWELLAPTAGEPAPEPAQPAGPVVEDGRIVGDPFAYSDDWFKQAFDGSCLPASVAQIYTEYTGQEITDLEFVDLVNQQGGWVVGPDGTPGLMPASAVDLLNSAGIDATLQYSDLDGLLSALDAGRAVMVAVDSGEYWFGEGAEDDTADHAVLVTGIDVEAGIVYLSDTGIEGGDMLQVPLDTFLDAWADSDNTMVVCEQSAEEFRTGQPATQSPIPPGQPGADAAGDLGDGVGFPAVEPQSAIEQTTSWLVQHPWIVLPIVLAAGAGIARLSK